MTVTIFSSYLPVHWSVQHVSSSRWGQSSRTKQKAVSHWSLSQQQKTHFTYDRHSLPALSCRDGKPMLDYVCSVLTSATTSATKYLTHGVTNILDSTKMIQHQLQESHPNCTPYLHTCWTSLQVKMTTGLTTWQMKKDKAVRLTFTLLRLHTGRCFNEFCFNSS